MRASLYLYLSLCLLRVDSQVSNPSTSSQRYLLILSMCAGLRTPIKGPYNYGSLEQCMLLLSQSLYIPTLSLSDSDSLSLSLCVRTFWHASLGLASRIVHCLGWKYIAAAAPATLLVENVAPSTSANQVSFLLYLRRYFC